MYLFRNKIFLLFSFLLILSYLLYFHTLHYSYFIYDDAENIFQNVHLTNHLWNEIKWYWTNSLTPIPYNVWILINNFLGNENPAPYRFINIMLHGLNSGFVYLFIKSLILKTSPDLRSKEIKDYAFFGALIFLIHPIATESVIWTSSLRTLLASSLLYLFLIETSKDDKANYLVIILLFLASILTNPIFSGVFFIGFIFSKKEKLFYWELSVMILLVLFFFYLHSTNVIQQKYFSFLTFKDHILLFNKAIFQYITISLFPFKILINFQLNPQTIFKDSFLDHTGYAVSSLLFFTIPFLFNKLVQFKKLFLALFLFFILSLITNLGIFLHDFSSISVTAARYAYMSSFVAWLVYGIVISKYLNFWRNLLTLIIFILLGLQIFQASKWSNPSILIKESIDKMGPNQELLMALALQEIKLKKYNEAEVQLLEILNQNPQSNEAMSNLVDILIIQKEYIKALKILSNINLNLNNFHHSLYYDFSKIYCFNGKKEEARYFIEKYLDNNNPTPEVINFRDFINETNCK